MAPGKSKGFVEDGHIYIGCSEDGHIKRDNCSVKCICVTLSCLVSPL